MSIKALVNRSIFAAAWLACGFAHAADPWVVRDFRVEGAQGISDGTIFNYLPINIGETITDQRIRESIRALYDTDFFQDIEFRRDRDTLVIAVLERPRIEEFSFSGNKDIKDEALERSLTDIGLAAGKIFDRSTLDDVTQSLTDEYYGRGKYAASITADVEDLPDNRVRLTIEIEEGERAKIRQINIVGNNRFDDEELLDQLELTTGNFLSFIRDDDRYSREALEGDLETLRSYYMDRGYADFRVGDAQVAISPDKKDIFVTISIEEGDVYTIADVDLAGDMVVPEEELRALLFPQPGQVFSQQLLSLTEQALSFRLGQDGYAFSQVRALPELNEETKEVDVTFFVDPQSRVYVRRINFNGAENANDEVFRRELRQLEGGYLSNNLVELSKARLQRLPYVESVDFETNPIAGSPDLVDIDFAVEEGLPGTFGGSLGFSESQGIILGGNFVHSNFMGTGNRVSLDLRGGKFYKVYALDFTDPYRNMDGLSRQISFQLQDITQFTSVTSDFSTETISGGITWGVPISERQTFRLGFSFQQAQLITSFFSSDQARQWVSRNGQSFAVPGADNVFGTEVRSLELVTGWSYENRNRVLFPDSGMRSSFTLQTAMPGSDIEYYVASFNLEKYFRLPLSLRFRINSDIGLAESYGSKTTAPPPFRNFYGGGPNSVRGFKESYLGPIDSLRNPNGGNMMFANQFELIVPTPEKLAGSTRIALFFDIGNVFHTGGIDFFDKLGDTINYDFDYDKLKRSFGLSIEWLAPMGLLKFSYAVPMNDDEATDRFYGDEVEQFQFSIGNAF
jgi:outer membrane protein insertion porin family